MHAKKSGLVLAVLLSVLTACSSRNAVPPDKSPVPAPRQETREELTSPAPAKRQQIEDNLAKSDEDAVEENINGFDLGDDESITQKADHC